MKQTQFTNKTFYWIIIVIIGVLMLWNIYAFLITTLTALLPLAIQALLLILIITKNQYAKIGIKLWALVFLTIASALQFGGKLLQDLAENFTNVNASHYITTGITMTIGILIVVFLNKTVKVIEVK